jgi:hypothetical protein
MSKKLPVFKTDEEAEDFLDQDLSAYISAENFAPFQFEYRPRQKSINLRISEELLTAVRAGAAFPISATSARRSKRHCWRPPAKWKIGLRAQQVPDYPLDAVEGLVQVGHRGRV